MAFWGDYFIYDGIPCTEFGLRLYEINNTSSGDGSFSVPSEISEDRISNKYKLTLLIIFENSCLMACVPSEKARWGKDGGPGGKETALAR